jgi:hypothetical protein
MWMLARGAFQVGDEQAAEVDFWEDQSEWQQARWRKRQSYAKERQRWQERQQLAVGGSMFSW